MNKLNLLFFSIIIPLFLINCSKLRELTEQPSSSCAATECHPSTPLQKSLPDTGKHNQHLAVALECSKCHYNYIDNKNHKNGTTNTRSSITIVFFDSQNPSGKWKNSTTTCENMSCHGSVDWYGSGSISCELCHVSGNTTGAVDPVTTNGAGTSGKHVKHVSDKGIPCEKCHNEYKAGGNHADGTLDTGNPAVILTLFDSTNPTGSWNDDTGPQTGNCSSLACHGVSTLDWYGTGTWTLPACSDCHGAPLNSLRQVLGAGGDFEKSSHHVIDYGDRTNEIIIDADCLVCHDNDSHMAGAVRLKDKDNSGNVIVYDPASVSSLEPFCLGCHDSDGATADATPFSPFSNGTGGSPNTLGSEWNIAGVKIKESWDKLFGHRAEGLTCMGSGTPGSGCHGNYNTVSQTGSVNGHGSGNAGLLANKYTLPITTSTWDETRYSLCFECHNSDTSFTKTISDLFGVAEGGNYAQSQANYNEWPYVSDFMDIGFHDYMAYGMDRQFNLHLYHLIQGMGGWNYRSMSGSIPSCVNCHNVHGVASNDSYFLWDEWNYTAYDDGGINYGEVNKVYNGGNSKGDFGCSWGDCDPVVPAGPTYPDFCQMNCHWQGVYRYPRTNYNEAKAVAGDTSGLGAGLQDGDTITVYFSDSTNRPIIDETNIDTVLDLPGANSWIDTDKGGGGGQLAAVWSSIDGKTDNVLTITIYIANSPAGDPTIDTGDSITFDLSTITGEFGNPVRGKMTITGSF